MCELPLCLFEGRGMYKTVFYVFFVFAPVYVFNFSALVGEGYLCWHHCHCCSCVSCCSCCCSHHYCSSVRRRDHCPTSVVARESRNRGLCPSQRWRTLHLVSNKLSILWQFCLYSSWLQYFTFTPCLVQTPSFLQQVLSPLSLMSLLGAFAPCLLQTTLL